jgi:hypothetical protein
MWTKCQSYYTNHTAMPAGTSGAAAKVRRQLKPARAPVCVIVINTLLFEPHSLQCQNTVVAHFKPRDQFSVVHRQNSVNSSNT